jgi:hypothetical protein
MGIDKHLRILLGCIALAACSAAHAISIEVVPPNPGYFEPVHLRVTMDRPPLINPYGEFVRDARVSMVATTILVGLQTFRELGSGGPTDIFLGRFPAGAYTVQLSGSSTVTAQFIVRDRAWTTSHNISGDIPVADVNGLWWAPDEPGWGVSITHGPADLLATWFTHDANGQPQW